ncbi:hypothetical protein V5279_22620 [Bradyrhizobium sp. 26S5]|uniref:hypothetical protein n=1 Tax=Bradyrhizobium sp. 26S5 TaxID=3139729 RepID=UPI0030CE6B0F
MDDATISISSSTDAGGPLIRIEELPQADGRPARFVTLPANLRPLGYAELIQARPDKKLTISINWDGTQIIDTNIEGLDKKVLSNANGVLESHFTSRAIGLVKGGWLPPAFAATNSSTILIDRNIVSQIVGRFDRGKAVGADPDFLDLFADQPVKINPLLFAMEGNTRAIPTAEQVRDQLDEVITKLRTALPSAKLVVGPGSLQGALGLIEDTRAGITRKQQFLMRLAPSLATPVSRADMPARRDEVFATADQCGVSRSSLVVLAALSAAFFGNGVSPAKRLLKFKAGYREEDAYNALVDLRSLEMLIYLFAFFPDESTMLCTADRNLALFWTGIRASNFERNGAAVRFDLSPTDELLPGAVNEWRDHLGQ